MTTGRIDIHSETQPLRALDDFSVETVAVLRLSAFAAESFGGNPAGLVLDATALSDVEMQSIAVDVGFSETAFVVNSGVDGDPRHVKIRYFSPDAEVPFCGHATIATAVMLAMRLDIGAFTIDTAVGPIIVNTAFDDDGRIMASFTSVEPIVRDLDAMVAARLMALLGLEHDDLDESLPMREAFAGNWHPIVAIRMQHLFDRFTFDPTAVRALMDEQGWAGTVTVICAQPENETLRGTALAFEARNLFPVGEITEDPATGSAAASLGAYLRTIKAVAPPARIVVYQGRHVDRPSVLLVDIPTTGGITVSGTAELLQ